ALGWVSLWRVSRGARPGRCAGGACLGVRDPPERRCGWPFRPPLPLVPPLILPIRPPPPPRRHAYEPPRLAGLLLDGGGALGMLLEVFLRVLPSLTDLLVLIGIPGTALMDESPLARQVQEVPLARDAFAIHHVKFRLPEGRGHLVLHHLHPHPAAGRLVALFDLADAPHIQPNGGIEFEGIAAGRRLRVAHEHPDLLAQLVDEDHLRPG